MGNTETSDRLKAMKDLNINLEEGHRIVPSDHAPRKEQVKQTENSLWIWERNRMDTELLYEGPLAQVEQ